MAFTSLWHPQRNLHSWLLLNYPHFHHFDLTRGDFTWFISGEPGSSIASFLIVSLYSFALLLLPLLFIKTAIILAQLLARVLRAKAQRGY